ncbi:MAG: DUF5305 family protein, partial [Saccharofermentanales bacterium]
VRIDALQATTYILKAESLWEREFAIREPVPLQASLGTSYLSDGQVTLKLGDVYDFIQNVEDETANRANYSLTVRQRITGKIYDEEDTMIHAISLELQMPFEVYSQYMKFIGDPKGIEEKTVAEIESVKSMPQRLNLTGLSLSIVYSRIGFSITALILIALLLLFTLISRKNAAEQPEDTGIIEKRNKGKIIPVTKKINLDAVTGISLDSLNDLMKIAEEKEEAVYKYAEAEQSFYYMVNSSFIYSYVSADNDKGNHAALSGEGHQEPHSSRSADASGPV